MTCITCSHVWLLRRFFFISCNVSDSTAQIETWVSEGSLASISLLAVLHISLFHSVHFQQLGAEEYFKSIQGRVVFSCMENFIYPWYSRKCRFLNLFLPSYSKPVFAHLGMALHVLSLPVPGQLHHLPLLRCCCCYRCYWKGEFTLHTSPSESSLKLPPSESEYFTISLTISVLTVSLWSIFWTTTPTRIFHCVWGTWNISYLHSEFTDTSRAACWERSMMIHCEWPQVSTAIKQRLPQAKCHTACCTSVLCEGLAYTLLCLA